MVINGAAEVVKRSAPEKQVSLPLEMIATAVKRGQKLTGQLLSFARRQTLETEVIDLAETLPHISEMLKRSLRGDIELKTFPPDRICRARVDPGELELALLNLGVNARDAMPDGGVLSLAVRRVRLSGEMEVDGLRGEFVAIELMDCGIGIAAEVLPRVFDPYFTTKDAGKGTGLGLSQVYGFAKQSGGTAIIQSRLGHGTTVSIYLPATEEPVQAERKHPILVDQIQSAEGTALLVEDNEEVASVSAAYLEQLGYTVEVTMNGSDALQKLQSGHSYDLVFSDLLMPGSVAGLELARFVRSNHPNIPILLTTGYSQKAQEAVREGFFILRKPFDPQSLFNAICELRAKSALGRVVRATKPQITDVDLDELFDGLRVEFAEVAATKGLQLEILGSNETARTDPKLLGQVLRNLLSNALKFTHEGSVRMQCVREAGQLRINVTDTGRGIASEQMPHIFDEFYQAGGMPNTAREGNGLGLSIVHKLIQLLGHQIKVGSTVGEGSNFSIVLPVGSARSRVAPPTKGSSQEIRRDQAHVMVVEDDALVLSAICSLLEIVGYRVTGVASIGEAQKLAHNQNDISLLITDFHLANGELGTEVIRSIRSVLGRDVKAVLLTGDTSSRVQIIARENDAFLMSKPINADEFFGLLGRN
jgi:signal transduction histidine kinase